MKKICLLIILVIVFNIFGCSQVQEKDNTNDIEYEVPTVSADYEDLLIKYDELESKYFSLLTDYNSIYNKYSEMFAEKETTSSEIEIIYPTLPIEVSYVDYDGLNTKGRIDKVSYTYDAFNDGTCSLFLYFSGQKLYDRDGDDSLTDTRFYAVLYDENGNVAYKESVIPSKIKTNEYFTDCDRIFLNVKLGHTYTLKIFNYD